jgi:hypothetical protein
MPIEVHLNFYIHLNLQLITSSENVAPMNELFYSNK